MFDAITESGTVYRIDTEDGFWIRFPKGEVSRLETRTERLWSLQVGEKLCSPWEDESAWEEAPLPEVGKHLYVASRDVWYVSQKIVKLVEVESWTSSPSKL